MSNENKEVKKDQKEIKKEEIRQMLEKLEISIDTDQCQCGYAEPTKYAVITRDKFQA